MAGTSFKSRSKLRTQIRSPGSNHKTHFRKKNPKGHFCGVSGQFLNGIPKLTNNRFNKLSKSKKRPNRKFGGTYSHKVVKFSLEKHIWES